MQNKNPVQETLDIILVQLKDLDRQVVEKKRTANDLCRLMHQSPMFSDADAAAYGVSTRSDEYYGLQAADVIRTILEKRKRANLGAATVNEIYSAMIEGGYQFQTENDAYAKRGIYGIVGRETQFHQLPGGGVGLTSWYPSARAKPEETAREKPRRKVHRKTLKKNATPHVASPETTASPKGAAEANGVASFGRGELLRVVGEIVQSLPRKFTTLDVVAKIEEQTKAEVKRPSVKAALDRLEEKGIVKIIEHGTGQKPSVYTKPD